MTIAALGRRQMRPGRCINPVGSSAPEKTKTRRAHSASFLSNSPFWKATLTRGVTMSNQTRLGSFNTSNVDVNNFLGAPIPKNQDGSYAGLYGMSSGSMPIGQSLDGLHAPWSFPMGNTGSANADNMNEQQTPHMSHHASTLLPQSFTGEYARYTSEPQTIKTEALGDEAAVPLPQVPSAQAALPAPQRSVPQAGMPVYREQRNLPRHASMSAIPSTPTNTTPADTNHDHDNNNNNTSSRASGKKRSMAKGEKDSRTGRRKIKIEFIDDDSRRHITFSKRKAGIMKKAYELATLTGTQVLLLVVSQTGLVYTFTTPKLEAVVKQPEGRNLIQECLNAPDPSEVNDNEAEAGPSTVSSMEGGAIGGLQMVGEEPYDEEEDDDEDGDEPLDIGRADAGFTAQAMGTAVPDLGSSDSSNVLGHAPLFHPGWTPLSNRSMGDGSGTPSIKRRRTQPNLSRTQRSSLNTEPVPELQTDLYHASAMMSSMPVNNVLGHEPFLSSNIPMFLGQDPSLGAAPPTSHDAPANDRESSHT